MPIQTLNELYAHGLGAAPKARAFLTKTGGRYREVSSQQFTDAGREIALGLIALGLAPGDRVAVLSPTRLEWSQVDMGVLGAGLVSVPIYPNVTRSMVEYIVGNAGARAIFVADAEQAAKTARLREKGDFMVVQFDGESPGTVSLVFRLRPRTPASRSFPSPISWSGWPACTSWCTAGPASAMRSPSRPWPRTCRRCGPR